MFFSLSRNIFLLSISMNPKSRFVEALLEEFLKSSEVGLNRLAKTFL